MRPTFRAAAIFRSDTRPASTAWQSLRQVRHLPTRPEGLPSGPSPLQAGLGAAFDAVQFLLRRPGEDAGQDVADHRLGRVGVGVQVAGPRLLGGGQRPESHLAVAEVPDRVNGVHPVTADPVHRGDHQNVAGV